MTLEIIENTNDKNQQKLLTNKISQPDNRSHNNEDSSSGEFDSASQIIEDYLDNIKTGKRIKKIDMKAYRLK